MKENKYSYVQPIWQLAILTILTLGLYVFYWFYRNWKHFKEFHGLNISPGWRTAGLFAPILSWILMYQQLEYISTELKVKEKSISPGLVLFIFFIVEVLMVYFGANLYTAVFSVVPLIMVQDVLNFYWEKEQNDLPIRTKLLNGEIVTLIIGGILAVYIHFI